MAAPMFSVYTTTYRLALRQPTTKSAGEWPLRNSRGWSRPVSRPDPLEICLQAVDTQCLSTSRRNKAARSLKELNTPRCETVAAVESENLVGFLAEGPDDKALDALLLC